MLEVDDILPSPLTPLVLAPTVPEPVCEKQTPALFTVAQSSPQPESVETANYARMNPLPSSATSSSSSGKLHLYIDSDTSSPSVPIGPQSSSLELLLQGTSQVPQPPPLFSTAHTAVSTKKPRIQPTHIPSWADEVTRAEQSGHSTPETVVPQLWWDPWSTTTITATGLPTASDAHTAYTTPAGTLNAVRSGFTTSETITIFPSDTPLRPTHVN